MRKWIVAAIVVLILLPLLAVGGGVLWLMHADLRPLAERKLTEALDRPVKIGALTVDWADPLVLDIRDASIANPPWGEPAEMLTLGHLSAEIEVGPLLHGTLRYRKVEIEKLVLVLERNPQGLGNWKVGDAAKTGTSNLQIFPGPAIIPKTRQQMPTMLDFAMRESQVRYRTTSGRWLTIDLSDIAVKTDGDDQPVTVSGNGAYNKIPAKLQVGTDSFAKFRDASQPFGMTFAITNDTSAINFHGTSMDPLDFDGVKGAMTIDTKDLGALLKVLDADIAARLPLGIAGNFAHDGDHWTLDQAKGELGDNPFTGALVLDEGPRGGTDHLALDLDFDRLLLDSVMDRIGDGKGPQDPMQTKLDMPGKNSPEFKLQLAAKDFRFHKLRLAAVRLRGAVGPGHLNVDQLAFPFAGATLNAQGSAKQSGTTTAVMASADLIGANITDFLKTFDIVTNDIAGKVDARVQLSGAGSTLDDLMARGDGEAVLAMRQGKVSKDVLEKASVDLRTIFRKGEGMSPVDCLLGVAEVKDGVATISPLMLRSPDATLVGGGTIDLRKKSVDLVIHSDPKSTGFLALDIPIHVSGPLGHPSAKPSSGSKVAVSAPAALSPATQRLVQQSGCTQ